MYKQSPEAAAFWKWLLEHHGERMKKGVSGEEMAVLKEDWRKTL